MIFLNMQFGCNLSINASNLLAMRWQCCLIILLHYLAEEALYKPDDEPKKMQKEYEAEFPISKAKNIEDHPQINVDFRDRSVWEQSAANKLGKSKIVSWVHFAATGTVSLNSIITFVCCIALHSQVLPVIIQHVIYLFCSHNQSQPRQREVTAKGRSDWKG